MIEGHADPQKIKILEQRWETLRLVCREFVTGTKELTVRDLAHHILIGQDAIDAALAAGIKANAQWIEQHGEPGESTQNALETFVKGQASAVVEKILSTPTPDLKEEETP